MSVNLRVHEVAQTDEHCRKCSCHCQAVKQPDVTEIIPASVFPHKPPHSQHDCYCSSVAGQSTFPHFKNEERVCQIVIGLVEEHMPKACTNYCTQQQCPQQGIKQLKRLVLPAEKMPEHIISKIEPHNEEESVIPQLETSNMENNGINIPVHKKHHILFPIIYLTNLENTLNGITFPKESCSSSSPQVSSPLPFPPSIPKALLTAVSPNIAE